MFFHIFDIAAIAITQQKPESAEVPVVPPELRKDLLCRFNDMVQQTSFQTKFFSNCVRKMLALFTMHITKDDYLDQIINMVERRDCVSDWEFAAALWLKNRKNDSTRTT
jgi:hypothetical protein